MRVDVLTIFPGIFRGFLDHSLIGSARQRGLLEVVLHDFRRYARGAHRSVDDKPFGGGPGMVLKPEPVSACLEELLARGGQRPRMLLPSPAGRRLDQALVRELSREEHLLLLCSRYEGYDERIVRAWSFEEVSIGDYVLMGGETAAMVIIETVARLIPGVLGHDLSALRDSFEQPLLGHPQYTRPASFHGMDVPGVLLSGDHRRIEEWRAQQARERTRSRRPDLLPPDPDPAPGEGPEDPA